MNASQYLFPPGIRIAFPVSITEHREGCPLFLERVAAGWPSPAEDYIEGSLDLHRYLVTNPASTFFAWASGDSMQGAGIFEGDLLVVDRSLDAISGSIVVAALEGELTIKRLLLKGKRISLKPENKAYPEILITNPDELTIWGVVKHAVHSFQYKR